MKLKLFATVVLLAAGAMTISAQEGCDQNSSLSHEYVKAGNFKDAYEPWKAVMKDCPTLRYYTYTDGFTLLEGLMKTQTKGSAQYQAYFDEMMAAYDQLTKHLGDFRATGIPTPERVLTNKIQDYLKLAPEIDAKYAYTELRKVTDLQKDAALGSAIFYMLQQSFALLANDATHKEQFLTDYMNSTEWMDKKIADTTSENTKASYARIRENLDALLINSGAATCESLEGIYKDKVETSKTDMEFLQQVLTVMRKLKCTETDTYFQAA
ncbi:MAG: hypothetical protein LBM61_00470, partial [Prevotellaceae bacterium]|nr:hypothetical protein [Prevotellaceae bacterium]